MYDIRMTRAAYDALWEQYEDERRLIAESCVEVQR